MPSATHKGHVLKCKQDQRISQAPRELVLLTLGARDTLDDDDDDDDDVSLGI